MDRDVPAEAFDRVRSLLAAPDLLFGNLEGVYTDAPQPAPSLGVAVFPARHNVQAFGAVGFDVMACANNHIVDAGHAAMLATVADLRAQGVRCCGVGESLAAARKPAVLEAGGSRVAFLSYASVFPMGYEARSIVPGLAPLRAYNHFHEAYANYHIPGTPPRMETIPDSKDLANLAEDIAAARSQADLVVAAFHWGDFLRPFHLTDHERRTARFCIDHGVDLVVGHHHHALRGMEWYQGKPILYGLGHFVFDCRIEVPAEIAAALALIKSDGYEVAPREGWPLLPLHPDTRMTVYAWVTFVGGQPTGIGFVPCRLRPDGRVDAVSPESDEGREVVEYMAQCNRTQGLNGQIEADGPVIGGRRSLRVVPSK